MVAIGAVTTTGDTAALCASVGLARATLYRRRQPTPESVPAPRAPSARALAPAEREAVLDLLHSERFVDQSPAEVQATLLSEAGCADPVPSGALHQPLWVSRRDRTAVYFPFRHQHPSALPYPPPPQNLWVADPAI